MIGSPSKVTNFSKHRDFIRSTLPEWKDLSDDEMIFHRFHSLTNTVYKVTATRDNITPNPVILRHLCEQDGFLNREKEAKVYSELYKTGFGLKFYRQEGRLRLEQYIPSRNIDIAEYKERLTRRKLARTMAAIHKINVPDVDRTTMFESALADKPSFDAFDAKCGQDIYDEDEKKIIETLQIVSSSKEREFLKQILPRDDVVFSHNDLLHGNILVTHETKDVVFIDYEYASYNFRGYDIGNAYKEATFDYTHSESPYFRVVHSNFPNEEELKDFLTYYLTFTDMETEELKKSDHLIDDDIAMEEYIRENYEKEDLDKRIENLKIQSMIGVMLSLYQWVIYAVKMHKTQDSEFKYLDLARAKFEYYQRIKSELFRQ